MGKVIKFPRSEKSRRLTIEVGEHADAALARRLQAEKDLNPTTALNRAIQVYDQVMQAQERGLPVVIGGDEYRIE